MQWQLETGLDFLVSNCFRPTACFPPFATKLKVQWQLETKFCSVSIFRRKHQKLFTSWSQQGCHLLRAISSSRTTYFLSGEFQKLPVSDDSSPATLLRPTVDSWPSKCPTSVNLSFGSSISHFGLGCNT